MRVVVVAPPQPVVSWADANEHLKLDGDETDRAYVEGLIAAATAHIDGPDGWLGRSIGMQTLELRLDHFGGRSCRYDIRLPYPPVTEIVSVKYVGTDGVETTVAPETYQLMGRDLALGFQKSWPSARRQREAVRIQYRAGYENVPTPIKAAILLMVGDLYRNRDTVAAGTVHEIPMSTAPAALLRPFMVFA